MNYREADKLQQKILDLYPYMHVSVRPIGDSHEYVCIEDGQGIYLWNEDDFLLYQAHNADYLRQFTQAYHQERSQRALEKYLLMRAKRSGS